MYHNVYFIHTTPTPASIMCHVYNNYDDDDMARVPKLQCTIRNKVRKQTFMIKQYYNYIHYGDTQTIHFSTKNHII